MTEVNRYLLILIILLIIRGVAPGQPAFQPTPVMQDNDSLIIHVNEYPLKIYQHEVKAGQTLYSIARYFGLTVNQLLQFNPDLDSTELPIGTSLAIPIPSRVIKRYKDSTFLAKDHIPIYYLVEKGENLFRISKAYFKMPVDTIARRNGLDSLNIVPGQFLHIGWMDKRGIPDSLQYKNPLLIKNYNNRSMFMSMSKDTLHYQDRGPAVWQESTIENDEFLALSNKVPVNSIIAIFNPMTKRTAYARVIGGKPAIFEDALVVVSEATAVYLGALDSRFYVEVAYPKSLN